SSVSSIQRTNGLPANGRKFLRGTLALWAFMGRRASKLCRTFASPGFHGEEVFLALSRRELTMFEISAIGSPELHQPEHDNLAHPVEQLTLLRRDVKIVENPNEKVAQEI